MIGYKACWLIAANFKDRKNYLYHIFAKLDILSQFSVIVLQHQLVRYSTAVSSVRGRSPRVTDWRTEGQTVTNNRLRKSMTK